MTLSLGNQARTMRHVATVHLRTTSAKRFNKSKSGVYLVHQVKMVAFVECCSVVRSDHVAGVHER